VAVVEIDAHVNGRLPVCCSPHALCELGGLPRGDPGSFAPNGESMFGYVVFGFTCSYGPMAWGMRKPGAGRLSNSGASRHQVLKNRRRFRKHGPRCDERRWRTKVERCGHHRGDLIVFLQRYAEE